MDFGLATAKEIGEALGARLKAVRLSQGLQQAEVAQRAGLNRGTVNNLENRGHASLGNFLKVVLALGLQDELWPLFQLRATSIAQMEQHEQAKRQRAPRRARARSGLGFE